MPQPIKLPFTSVSIGVSLSQVLMGAVPEPTHTIQWGNDIPGIVMHALRLGETATRLGEDGQPEAIILMDTYGTIREREL